jgi:aspartate 1-decarboxylase
MSVAWLDEASARKFKPQFVQVDQKNRIVEIHAGVKKRPNAAR